MSDKLVAVLHQNAVFNFSAAVHIDIIVVRRNPRNCIQRHSGPRNSRDRIGMSVDLQLCRCSGRRIHKVDQERKPVGLVSAFDLLILSCHGVLSDPIDLKPAVSACTGHVEREKYHPFRKLMPEDFICLILIGTDIFQFPE